MAIPDEPLTRTEQYLNRTATGGGTIPDEPLTRVEMYLNKIATGSGNTPDEPLTRVEMYLDEIAENGGGDSGGDSGGGSESMAVVADFTAQEDVQSIQIDFTDSMRGYDFYIVVLNGAFTAREYPCPAVNEEPDTARYINQWEKDTVDTRAFYIINTGLPEIQNAYIWSGQNNATFRKFTAPINYVKIATYYANSRFKTGFNVKVYGGKMA